VAARDRSSSLGNKAGAARQTNWEEILASAKADIIRSTEGNARQKSTRSGTQLAIQWNKD
jgi:hypothetical protein